jgi:nucleoside-diphosphate-sugar epimerase
MKVLITGAAGRLGYEVVKICTDMDVSVKAFDLPNVNWSHLEALGVEIHPGDITDIGSVRASSRDIDAVIHLAALLPPKTETNRDLTQRINVDGTENLVKSVPDKTRQIFASSIATYGVTVNEIPPVKESHPLVSHNNYAESKIHAERIIKQSDNPFTILRIAPVSVGSLLELPETVAYKADQRVEYVYVEDAAYSLYKCLMEEKNKIYNIASGSSWQMTGEEYLTRFYRALGVEVEPNYPEKYTAVDWYDTSQSSHLDYQRTNFNKFEEKLVLIGEELGLR